MNLKCKNCGSEKIIPSVNVMDQGQHSDGTLKAHVGYNDPAAILLREAVFARLKANICGACGYTELFASKPEELYSAYLKAKEYCRM
ncbi:MAG: hypothetical protein K0Q55_2314 [Verrucomicrobia bacterium]|jgi:predicted nucleic-acid-binding Zn-ribbon protein|nr:hypothetical protein [Verrucomicrobiota bacterium]